MSATAIRGADGNELAVSELGDGPPIVVLAGGPGAHGPLYRDCLRPLAKRWRVLFWDYRGCGGSAPAASYGMDHDLADLRAVCAAHDVTRPILLGHSYGGLLALREAIERKDAVAALVLVGPIASSEAFAAATKRKRARMSAEDREEWDALAKRCAAGDATAAELDRYWVLEAGNLVHDTQWAPQLVSGLRIDFDVLRAAQPSVAEVDLRPWLGDITAPVLVITGREDLSAGNDPILIAESIPGSELHRLEETGHTPFLEWNDRFLGIIAEWLSGLPR